MPMIVAHHTDKGRFNFNQELEMSDYNAPMISVTKLMKSIVF